VRLLLALAASVSPGVAAAAGTGITRFPIPELIDTGSCDPQLYAVAPGPGGEMWFTQNCPAAASRAGVEGDSQVGAVPSAGRARAYLVRGVKAPLTGIAAGPDGALWFGEAGANAIARVTSTGVLSEFPLPTAGALPDGIVAGPDGALWFTERATDRIGRITTAGAVTEYPLHAGSHPRGIVAGPDGALWFAEQGGSSVGRITTAGVVSETPAGTFAKDVAFSGDGALWLREQAGNVLERRPAGSAPSVLRTPLQSATPDAEDAFGPALASTRDGAVWDAQPAAGALARASGGISEFHLRNGGALATAADGALWLSGGDGGSLVRVRLALELPAGGPQRLLRRSVSLRALVSADAVVRVSGTLSGVKIPPSDVAHVAAGAPRALSVKLPAGAFTAARGTLAQRRDISVKLTATATRAGVRESTTARIALVSGRLDGLWLGKTGDGDPVRLRVARDGHSAVIAVTCVTGSGAQVNASLGPFRVRGRAFSFTPPGPPPSTGATATAGSFYSESRASGTIDVNGCAMRDRSFALRLR
jgi:virginiamycin B lyase